jgi:hypothetical protein
MNPLNGAFYQGAHYGTKIVTKSQFLCTPWINASHISNYVVCLAWRWWRCGYISRHKANVGKSRTHFPRGNTNLIANVGNAPYSSVRGYRQHAWGYR